MSDEKYRSSVLTCDVEEKGCPVCDFLGGDRTPKTMMAVIKVLDKELSSVEGSKLGMAKAIADLTGEVRGMRQDDDIGMGGW